MLRVSTLLLIIIVAIGTTSSPSVRIAQAEVGPVWTGSTTTRVKPDMVRLFERCLKQMRDAYRHEGALWFITFETFAGDTTEYTTLVPVMKFGDLDGPSKTLSEAGRKRLFSQSARCYTSQTREYATPQIDLDIRTEHAPLGIYWVETNTLVAPGKMADYLDWLKNDYRPALEKAGVARFQVSRPIFGATAGEVVSLRMLKSLAEIDAGTVLSRALSDQEAQEVAAKSVPLVTSSKTRIVRMRTDLSYSERW
jgi:hypothetical protein